jgi:hypothetical protein
MLLLTNNQLKRLTRQTGISVLLVIIAGLAFASKGGGGDKKNNPSLKDNFTPIRNGFTLKTGSSYAGSHIFSQEKSNNKLSLNTVITYQKGNTVYILPYKYKVNASSFSSTAPKTNLQFLGVKIQMPK